MENKTYDSNHYLDNISNERLKWIGIDLDGTLAEFIWPDRGIGPIKPGAKEAVDKLIDAGYKIVIFTARQWSFYESIEKWCHDNGLRVKGIICGKPLFRWFIDDRNFGFKNDWFQTVNELLEYDKDYKI